MRDVFLERGFAIGMFLLLWLYYRWLERSDAKRHLERLEKKRRDERRGSIPLPADLQWRGTPPGVVLRPEHYLEPRFATGLKRLPVPDRATEGQDAWEVGHR